MSGLPAIFARPSITIGQGVDHDWRPPPRAWHRLWLDGTSDLLPYGLLMPATDYLWRVMWAQPTYLNLGDIQDLCPGIGYRRAIEMCRCMIRYGCLLRSSADATASDSIRQGRQSGGRDGEPLYDWRTQPYHTEYRPIVPQTPTARHLRRLHSTPTPDPPPQLSARRAEIWALLTEAAVGAAAHISARAIGERLGLTAERTHGHLRHLRLHHPGVVQRIYGAQTAIWRLCPARRPKRTMAEVSDYHDYWSQLEGYRPRPRPAQDRARDRARLPAIAAMDGGSGDGGDG